METSRAPSLWNPALLAVLSAACIDASTRQPCIEAPPTGTLVAATSATDAATVPGTPAVAAAPLKTCGGAPIAAPDGVIDDFEDGNSQLLVNAGRDGYWWLHHDPKGSSIEPSKFAPEDGGAGGSKKALHVRGITGTEEGAYGSSVGINLMSKGLYDASKYVGIAFKAKVAPSSSTSARLKIGDVNTHGQLGTCKSCWNHFGQDMTFTSEWQEYKVLFSEAKQAQGWGDPRPPTLTANQLASIDFTIGPKVSFDLWIDDLTFLTCP